jgi:hypothetical protein
MNKKMQAWPARVHEKIRRTCKEAYDLFSKQVSPQDPSSPPFNRSKRYALNIEDQQFLEMIASPVINPAGQVVQVVAVVWDATGTRRLQQKIDAIDKAGRVLVRLEGGMGIAVGGGPEEKPQDLGYVVLVDADLVQSAHVLVPQGFVFRGAQPELVGQPREVGLPALPERGVAPHVVHHLVQGQGLVAAIHATHAPPPPRSSCTPTTALCRRPPPRIPRP